MMHAGRESAVATPPVYKKDMKNRRFFVFSQYEWQKKRSDEGRKSPRDSAPRHRDRAMNMQAAHVVGKPMFQS